MQDVVVAIIMKGERVLTEMRKVTNPHSPGMRRFPAGHVEKGESLLAAIKREMKEELNIEVTRAEKLDEAVFTGEDQIQRRLHYFLIEFQGQLPRRNSLEWIEMIDEVKMNFLHDQNILKSLKKTATTKNNSRQ